MSPLYGNHGLYPLWRATLKKKNGKTAFVYLIAPEKPLPRVPSVRSIVKGEKFRRHRVLALEKVSEHPIMRGTERVIAGQITQEWQ